MISRSAGPSLLLSPASGISFKNRYCTSTSAWVATNVPLPCLRTSRLSDASSSTALRTVPWLTRKRVASSISLGIDSPGFHSPACRLCRINALICWYNGLKEGVIEDVNEALEAGVKWAGAKCPAADVLEGVVATAGSAGEALVGFMVSGLNHILYKT